MPNIILLLKLPYSLRQHHAEHYIFTYCDLANRKGYIYMLNLTIKPGNEIETTLYIIYLANVDLVNGNDLRMYTH